MVVVVRIKEIKISIHRKYTRDFQSYGYRIGVMLDVGGVSPEQAYNGAKTFLNKKIGEEDLIIKNIMDVKDAQKRLGYEKLGRIPEREIVRTDTGGGYKELEKREGVVKMDVVDNGVAEKKRFVVSYACEGCGKWITGVKDKDGKVFCKNCGCMIYPYATRKSLDVGTESGKEGDGNVLVPFDVRQIIRTSDMAVLVELFGKKGDLWIPKSCIGGGDAMDSMERGVKIILDVKRWFLKKMGLVQ
ncbi:MAG: hypothetical protein CEE42_05215 [Promethearchaeota archaeon Loki_b31]|nr:MAG: hypothetical protein CEE42_05215 [Candidatus Lokiarchaeota archaeon Loki_b31]